MFGPSCYHVARLGTRRREVLACWPGVWIEAAKETDSSRLTVAAVRLRSCLSPSIGTKMLNLYQLEHQKYPADSNHRKTYLSLPHMAPGLADLCSESWFFLQASGQVDVVVGQH